MWSASAAAPSHLGALPYCRALGEESWDVIGSVRGGRLRERVIQREGGGGERERGREREREREREGEGEGGHRGRERVMGGEVARQRECARGLPGLPSLSENMY